MRPFGNSVSINVLQYILMAIIDNNNLMVLYRHTNTTNKIALVQKGSEIAKSGFKNEKILIYKINNWRTDKNAQKWLKIMEYNLNNLETA